MWELSGAQEVRSIHFFLIAYSHVYKLQTDIIKSQTSSGNQCKTGGMVEVCNLSNWLVLFVILSLLCLIRSILLFIETIRPEYRLVQITSLAVSKKQWGHFTIICVFSDSVVRGIEFCIMPDTTTLISNQTFIIASRKRVMIIIPGPGYCCLQLPCPWWRWPSQPAPCCWYKIISQSSPVVPPSLPSPPLLPHR